MTILTDDEMVDAVGAPAYLAAGRAVEAAVLAKLAQQEPVAQPTAEMRATFKTAFEGGSVWTSRVNHGLEEVFRIHKLYTHPAPPQADRQRVTDEQEVRLLLNRFELQMHRMGELWERCQSKGRPASESDEFTTLRDVKTPKTRDALIALLAAAPQQADRQRVPEGWRTALAECADLAWLPDSHAVRFDSTVVFGEFYDFDNLESTRREEFLAQYECVVWPGRKWSAYCTYEGLMWFEQFDTAEEAKEACMRLLDKVLPDHPAMKARAMLAAAPEAPAQNGHLADDERVAALCTLSYAAGMKAGWNYCASEDNEGFERSQKSVGEAIRILKAHRAAAEAPAQENVK